MKMQSRIGYSILLFTSILNQLTMTQDNSVYIHNPNSTKLIDALQPLANHSCFNLLIQGEEIELEAKAEQEFQSRLVLFGDLTWEKLLNLHQQCQKLVLPLIAMRINKPNKRLPTAIDLLLAKPLSPQTKQQLLAWAENEDVELCYRDTHVSLNKPGLIVMDMDSTAIQIECIDEIAKLAGVGEQVSAVTEQAMRGELDFAQSLKARVAALKGAPITVIDQVADDLPLMPGLEHLVKVLKQHQWKVVIASGGFTYMTEKLRSLLSLDKTVANQLGMENGQLTGQVHGAIIDAQAKSDTVLDLANKWGIPLDQTVAMGDGANDLAMMDTAALGVAFHAKPLVREKADVSVKKGGLDQLLYLL